MKNNYIKKNIFIIVGIIIASVISLSVLFNSGTAFAGDMYDTVYEDDFSSLAIDSSSWYSKDGMRGIKFNAGKAPVFTTKGPAGGCSITSKIPYTSERIKIELDIKHLDYGSESLVKENGFFALVYNIRNLDEMAIDSIYNPGKTNSDGILFKFHNEEGLIFASLKGGATKFADGSGNAIPKRTRWNYYDANAILTGKTTIDNTTLIFEFENGNATISKKPIGTEGNGEVVIKTTDGGMRNPEKAFPYTAVCFSESSTKIKEVEFTQFRVCEEGNEHSEKVLNEFSGEHINDWKILKTSLTDKINFSYEAQLALDENFSNRMPLVLRKKLTNNARDDKFESFYEFKTLIKVNSVSENSKFGLLSGIDKLTKGKIGNKETSFVYFTKTGEDVYLNCESYSEKDVPALIFSDKSVSFNEEGYIELYVKINNHGRITVKTGDNLVYDSKKDNEVYYNNYIGLALSGDNTGMNVLLDKIVLKNRYYNRPENSNIKADFNDNSFNRNEWNVMVSPYMGIYTNSAYVKDGKFFFDNCAFNTAVVSQRQYSDFEMQLDIDDIRREVVTDGAGNKNYPISSFIGMYWGVKDSWHRFANGISTEYPLVYIEAPTNIETWDRNMVGGKPEPTTIRCMGNGLNMSYQLSDHYDFWDKENEGKALTLKIKVVGKKVEIFVKYTTEEEWCNTDRKGAKLSLDMEKPMTGNVAVTTMGNNYFVPVISEGASCGHFSMDNLIVNNLDDNPSLVELEYKTSKGNVLEDFDYKDSTSDREQYKPVGKTEGGCASSVSVSDGLMFLIAVCSSLCFLGLRRRNDD